MTEVLRATRTEAIIVRSATMTSDNLPVMRSKYKQGPRWWTDAIEAFVVGTLRAEPRVLLTELRQRLFQAFPSLPPISHDTFAHILSGWVYTRHEDIGRTRRVNARAAGTKRGQSSAIMPTLNALVAEAQASGRFSLEIEPYLRDSDKALILRIQQAEASRLAKDSTQAVGVEMRVQSKKERIDDLRKAELLLRKFRRWKEGGRFLHLNRHHRDLRAELRVLLKPEEGTAAVEARMSKANLNATERGVIEHYLLATPPVTIPATAAILGRKHVTVAFAIMSSINKLMGRDARYQLKVKYLPMRDDQIIAIIREHGFTSRLDVVRSDHALADVARARGILDDLFPKRRSAMLKELTVLVNERLQTASLTSLLKNLSALEVGVLIHRALSKEKRGFRFFQRTYDVKAPSDIALAERRLVTRFSRRDQREKPRDRLREFVLPLSAEDRARVMAQLHPREVDVLQRRVLSEQPVLLSELGRAWGVSRERARQVEEGLYDKVVGIVTAGSRHASLSKSADRGTCLRLQRAIWREMDEGERAYVRRLLRSTRLMLLEQRVAAEEPWTIEQVAEARRRTVFTVVQADIHLLELLKASPAAAKVETFVADESARMKGRGEEGRDPLRRWRTIRTILGRLSPEETQVVLRESSQVDLLLLEKRGLVDTPTSLESLAQWTGRAVSSLEERERRLLIRLRTTLLLRPPSVSDSTNSDT